MIEARGLSKRYGDKVAVDDLSLYGAARPGDRLPRAERRGQARNGIVAFIAAGAVAGSAGEWP